MSDPERAPLTGFRVAVTSARRADELCTLLRRRGATATFSSETISVGPLEVDIPGRRARVNGADVDLTKREFDLLAVLAEHKTAVLSRAQLLELVWGYDFAADTKPEQVIVVGHPTLHRDVMALLADPDIEVVGISRTETFTGQPDKRGSRVNAAGQPTDTWLKICEAAGDVGADTVRQALTEDEFGFTGLHVAAAVCDTLGVGDTLVLGSSNPVRDASFVGMPFDGVSTYSARGAAGIDGTVSITVNGERLHPPA